MRTVGRWGLALLSVITICGSVAVGAAGSAEPNAWQTVAQTLQTNDTFAHGYHRFGLPRRDLTVHVGDVTLAPELAQGAWVGFSDDAGHAMMMGDLVLTGSELGPVLAELQRQNLDVTAIHNHLAGEEPRLTYVHVHGMGAATDLAKRLDHVLALTGTPRPVAPAATLARGIDTTAVFREMGKSGTVHGTVAQLSYILVPGDVTMDGEKVPPALGYGSPVNIQLVAPGRAVATGDFAVRGDRVGPLLRALAKNRITATALHTHMIGESPQVYFIHFWADGEPGAVVKGLRAAVDAARAGP